MSDVPTPVSPPSLPDDPIVEDQIPEEPTSGSITATKVVKTKEQREWLEGHYPDFLEHQIRLKTQDFWPWIYREYLTKWPVPRADDPTLSPEERELTRIETKVQKKASFIFHPSNSYSVPYRRLSECL